jgi:Helicase conserved C-terminal domain
MSCKKCRCDEGYELPPMTMNWHEIPSRIVDVPPTREGQGRMFLDPVLGLSEAAHEKRQSMDDRIARMIEIAEAYLGKRKKDRNGKQIIVWCELNDEQDAIEKAFEERGISCTSLRGSSGINDREIMMDQWRNKETCVFLSKLALYGSGANLQQCHFMIYVGIAFKFSDFIQGLHRVWRFLQKNDVQIHAIYTEAEQSVRKILEGKWDAHKKQLGVMSEIIREHGLASINVEETMRRTIGCERKEASGERFRFVNNDSIVECGDRESMPDNSVHLMVTSVPFSFQYEYSPCYDEQTQILTRRGWLSFGDLRPDDMLATIDQNTQNLEWQTPTAITWEPYVGPMLHFHTRGIFDLLVTPQHKMYVDTRVGNHKTGRKEKKLELITAEHIANNFVVRKWRMMTATTVKTSTVGTNPNYIDVPQSKQRIMPQSRVIKRIATTDMMRLAGWYLSEGHCRDGRGLRRGEIAISQSKKVNPEFREEIVQMFMRIGLPVNQNNEKNVVAWNISIADFLRSNFGVGSYTKRIPRWVKDLCPSMLSILRDTMMKGDGNANGMAYTSYSEQLRNDFQEICFMTGWRSCISGNVVRIGQTNVCPEIREKPDTMHYEGMIGCATVPNHTLVVRRNGKCIVSGNSYNDLGHTESNIHFWAQMDFLAPNLLRILSPGRVFAVHVKDRIVPGGVNGFGFQTLHPFHAEAIYHYQKHGFAFLGMKTIVTDVVRENNQTYRLGWTEQCKDGSRMGCGVPEYVLLFRKPPTDRSNGYADIPIVKDKPLCDDSGEPMPFDSDTNWRKPIEGTGYSRSKWQLDAHGFARSGGNRLLTRDELHDLPHEKIFKKWRDESINCIHDHNHHVANCEIMDRDQRLPATFMVMPPHSWHPDVWTDIARMRTLNMEQERKGNVMHLCPLQFDIVDRLINQFSMPGEIVFDPFGGLGTVPYCAIKLGRIGQACELNGGYWKDGVRYCKSAEANQSVPNLFDLVREEDELALID